MGGGGTSGPGGGAAFGPGGGGTSGPGGPGGPGGGDPAAGGPGGRSRNRLTILAAAVALVVVAGGVTAYAATRPSGHTRSTSSGAPRTVATPTARPSPVPPLQVTSISPAKHARHVDGADPVQITFSAPVAAGSPLPRIVPRVRGSWQHSGDQLVFTPSVPFTPGTKVTVRIPGGPSGVRSAAGAVLASRVVTHFRTHGWSLRRLEQILATLDYLPLKWKPRGTGAATAATSGMAAQLAAVYAPPHGRFVWRHGYPAALTSQWSTGNPGVILRGALMAFQSVHGLAMTGTTSPTLWKDVLRAMAKDQRNPNGYTYALASKVLPETLTVWHNGTVVMHGLANTGIPASPTANGTFPVYLRYRHQIMKGVNPNGSHYSDPVQYVSYFNGGDAVHQYYRASYGFPQSLGCVELPLNEAATVWPYLTYGSLVTVTG